MVLRHPIAWLGLATLEGFLEFLFSLNLQTQGKRLPPNLPIVFNIGTHPILSHLRETGTPPGFRAFLGDPTPHGDPHSADPMLSRSSRIRKPNPLQSIPTSNRRVSTHRTCPPSARQAVRRHVLPSRPSRREIHRNLGDRAQPGPVLWI